MNQKILFEIKKFPAAPVFFTDRKKIFDFFSAIKNLPKNSTIIIREYDLKGHEREAFAKKIIALAKIKKAKILIGKDFNLAKKLKADGVHFSDFDRLPWQFFKRKSFPKKFIFSLACHSFGSLLKAQKLKTDLIFISPIFASTSHADVKPLGLKNLAKITFKTKNSNYLASRIRALGGVNSTNLKRLRKLGIQGFGAIDLFK
jgi:thiamine monophosphate synthase